MLLGPGSDRIPPKASASVHLLVCKPQAVGGLLLVNGDVCV